MADPAIEALAARIADARARRQPLEIRGGGTKGFLGAPAAGEVLDTRGVVGISSYEPTELVVTVRAGTPLAELEEALAEEGQCLAFEPPRFHADAPSPPGPVAAEGDVPVLPPVVPDGVSTAALPVVANGYGPDGADAAGGTVGGMVAAGLAGPSRAAVGGVRDFVLGATMLSGRGELLSFGGQVMKNVAGYDVSRLLAGSWGVLGVVVEVSLKVLPRPPAQATLRFEVDQAGAIARLNRWGGQPLPLHASAWWNGLLVVRLAGAAAAVDAAAAQLGGERVDDVLASSFWDGLRDQRDEFFVAARQAVAANGAVLWRLSLPATAPVLALPGELLLEWGGAQRWLLSDAPEALVRAAAAQAGGHAMRWLGGAPGEAVFAALPAPLDRIHRELKAAFDPDGILNPGRLVPGL
ncbi:MAG: glycolate oxidase subunit GlcE [Rubrivivax sp.]|jgi:glycolate oxidase FAD binding subunit|nr:glycolate oxidase subunit GlcE [Rubrivivax sp.]